MIPLDTIYKMDCLEGLQLLDSSPDLIVTDPPFEFGCTGNGLYNQKELMNRIREVGTHKFDFEKYIPKILSIQKDKVNAYFFCNKALVPKYLEIAKTLNLNFDILVLRKINPIPAKKSSYMPELEYIIFLRSQGAFFNGSLDYSKYKKVYSIKIGHYNLKHPNQKPIELIKNYVSVSSKENDIILDPFLGSGTTALACKQLNRRFIGFEINQEYCQIARERLKQADLTAFGGTLEGWNTKAHDIDKEVADIEATLTTYVRKDELLD